MALTDSIIAWGAWRFLSGLASAGLFILASGLVLYYLGQHQRLHWSGYLYTGIGGGIALTGLFVPPLLDIHLSGLANWQSAWLGMAVLGMILGLFIVSGLWTTTAPPRRQDQADTTHTPHNPWLKWLGLAYFCEGMGYIISGTFLVAMFARMPELHADATQVWIWVGLAGIPGSLFWAWVAKRASYWHALVAAHCVQAAGMLAPVMIGGTFSAYFSAVSYGGTFISIVGLTLTWAKSLEPHRATQVVSILTLAFSLGQILGPVAAGQLSVWTGQLELSLWLAAAVVMLGAVFLVMGRVIRRP
jgi:predicted MFS family arabinose efflux permease